MLMVTMRCFESLEDKHLAQFQPKFHLLQNDFALFTRGNTSPLLPILCSHSSFLNGNKNQAEELLDDVELVLHGEDRTQPHLTRFRCHGFQIKCSPDQSIAALFYSSSFHHTS